jgi:hypothetical protein
MVYINRENAPGVQGRGNDRRRELYTGPYCPGDGGNAEKDGSGPDAITGSFWQRASGYRRAEHATDPKIAESRATSLRRAPLAQKTMRRLMLGFLKKEIQLARCGIGVQFFVQRAWSRSRSHLAMRVNSSGARLSIALSISSTRSICGV